MVPTHSGFTAAHHTPRFNLVDEPLLPAVNLDDGKLVRLSLAATLTEGHYHRLTIGDPARDDAVFRLLMAMTYLVAAYDDGRTDWVRVAAGDRLPEAAVNKTLQRVHRDMWLWHPIRPAFQEKRLIEHWPNKSVPKGGPAAPPTEQPWLDKADPVAAIVPHEPAKSETALAAMRFTDPAASDAELALSVLVRHYYAPAGNVTANSYHGIGATPGGSVAITGKTRHAYTRQSADTVAASLAVNLLSDWLERITPDNSLYWEQPDDDAGSRFTDPLWTSTASCAAMLLGSSDDGLPAVIRSVALVSNKDTLSARRAAIVANDPYLLRAADRNGEPFHVVFDPAASQYQWMRDMLAAAGPQREKLLTPGVLVPHATVVPPRTGMRLTVTSVRLKGSPTGRKFEHIERFDLDPDRFIVDDPDKHDTVLDLLEQVGGQSKSLASQTRWAVRQALDTERTPDGFDRLLYRHLDPILSRLVETALTDPDHDGLLDHDTKRQLVNAAMHTYDELCGPYQDNPSKTPAIEQGRHILRGRLWTLIS